MFSSRTLKQQTSHKPQITVTGLATEGGMPAEEILALDRECHKAPVQTSQASKCRSFCSGSKICSRALLDYAGVQIYGIRASLLEQWGAGRTRPVSSSRHTVTRVVLWNLPLRGLQTCLPCSLNTFWQQVCRNTCNTVFHSTTEHSQCCLPFRRTKSFQNCALQQPLAQLPVRLPE